jgi:hypothetical protein
MLNTIEKVLTDEVRFYSLVRNQETKKRRCIGASCGKMYKSKSAGDRFCSACKKIHVKQSLMAEHIIISY